MDGATPQIRKALQQIAALIKRYKSFRSFAFKALRVKICCNQKSKHDTILVAASIPGCLQKLPRVFKKLKSIGENVEKSSHERFKFI